MKYNDYVLKFFVKGGCAVKKCISILMSLILALSSVALFATSASAVEESLTVNATSNITQLFPGSSMKISPDAEKVTVTYWYNVQDYALLNCEFVLKYDKEYLEYDTTEGVNEKPGNNGNVALFIKPAIDDNGNVRGVIYNTNPASYEGGAIKANFTDLTGSNDCEGKTAFVSVTFKVLKNSGETTVNLDLRTLGFLESDGNNMKPHYLVFQNQLKEDHPEFITDKSYSVAYEGDYNENYVPRVKDENLRIGMNLSLSVNLTTSFFLTAESVGEMTDPTLNIYYSDSFSTVNKDLTGTKVTINNVEYYRFIYEGINPQRMHDEYALTVTASENGIIHYNTDTKSVRNYIYTALQNPQNSKWYRIFTDLLFYGSNCQIYKGYYADDLIKSGLEEEPYASNTDLQAIVTEENTKISNDEVSADNYYLRTVNDGEFSDVDNPQAEYKGVQLVLGNIITMRYNFNIADTAGKSVRVVRYANNNGEKGTKLKTTYIPAEKFEKYRDGYYISFKELSAHQMRDFVYFTVVDSEKNPIGNTTRFSVESELAIRRNYYQTNCSALSEAQRTATKKLIDLEKTMILYGDAVIEYLNNTN